MYSQSMSAPIFFLTSAKFSASCTAAAWALPDPEVVFTYALSWRVSGSEFEVVSEHGGWSIVNHLSWLRPMSTLAMLHTRTKKYPHAGDDQEIIVIKSTKGSEADTRLDAPDQIRQAGTDSNADTRAWV